MTFNIKVIKVLFTLLLLINLFSIITVTAQDPEIDAEIRKKYKDMTDEELDEDPTAKAIKQDFEKLAEFSFEDSEGVVEAKENQGGESQNNQPNQPNQANQANQQEENKNINIPDLTDTSSIKELDVSNLKETIEKYVNVLLVITTDENISNHTKCLLEVAQELLFNDPPIYVAHAHRTIDLVRNKRFPNVFSGSLTLNVILITPIGEYLYDYDGSNAETSKIINFSKSHALTNLVKNEDYTNLTNDEKYAMTVIFFYDYAESKYPERFLQTAKDPVFANKPIKFAIAFFETVGMATNQFSNNVLIKKILDDREYTLRNGFSYESLKIHLLNHYELYFGTDKQNQIFGDLKPGLILFRADELNDKDKRKYDEEFRKVYDIMRKNDPEIENKLVFTIIGITNVNESYVADFARVTHEDIKIAILDTRSEQENEWQTYILDKEITQENIIEFVDKFFANQLEFSIVSEPIPTNNDFLPIKHIVGNNYVDLVLNSKEDFFLMLVESICTECNMYKERFTEVHSEIAELNNHIKFGVMNYSKNNIQGISPERFPTLYFYKAGEKENPIFYGGDKSTEDMLVFLKTNSSKPVKVKSLHLESEDILDKVSKLGNKDGERDVNKERNEDKEDDNVINLDKIKEDF